jgi:hypothetical protein
MLLEAETYQIGEAKLKLTELDKIAFLSTTAVDTIIDNDFLSSINVYSVAIRDLSPLEW